MNKFIIKYSNNTATHTWHITNFITRQREYLARQSIHVGDVSSKESKKKKFFIIVVYKVWHISHTSLTIRKNHNKITPFAFNCQSLRVFFLRVYFNSHIIKVAIHGTYTRQLFEKVCTNLYTTSEFRNFIINIFNCPLICGFKYFLVYFLKK